MRRVRRLQYFCFWVNHIFVLRPTSPLWHLQKKKEGERHRPQKQNKTKQKKTKRNKNKPQQRRTGRAESSSVKKLLIMDLWSGCLTTVRVAYSGDVLLHWRASQHKMSVAAVLGKPLPTSQYQMNKMQKTIKRKQESNTSPLPTPLQDWSGHGKEKTGWLSLHLPLKENWQRLKGQTETKHQQKQKWSV